MKRVVDYITEKENNEFCQNCDDLICSRHCVIWRKAEMRCDEEQKEEQECIKAD